MDRWVSVRVGSRDDESGYSNEWEFSSRIVQPDMSNEKVMAVVVEMLEKLDIVVGMG